MQDKKPWTLKLYEADAMSRAVLGGVFRLYHGATPEDLRAMPMNFGDEEPLPFTEGEIRARYVELANAAEHWFSEAASFLTPKQQAALTAKNALLRWSEGVADPYVVALDACFGKSSEHEAFRKRLARLGRDRYFALIAAYSLKAGAHASAVESLLFAQDMALSRARAKGEGAASLLREREEQKGAQLAAARASGQRQRARHTANRKQDARAVAIAHMQNGHLAAPAEDIWRHVAGKIGRSADTARRLLGSMKALRMEAREHFKRDRERRLAGYGGLR